MADDADLVGHGPAQGSLFGDGDDRLQVPVRHYLPEPEKVRQRLNALLEKARSAEKMPWSERDARMWQTVFPEHGQLVARRRSGPAALRVRPRIGAPEGRVSRARVSTVCVPEEHRNIEVWGVAATG